MNIEALRDYCLKKKKKKKQVSESFPFDDSTLVFKVADKMFALCSIKDEKHSVNLKCDPEYAIQLREDYHDSIIPGYHMNKRHWNIMYYEQLQTALIKQLIDHSYDLVVSSLSNKKRETLGL